jgi:membrane-associated phospholipid phosphatase
MLFRSELPRPVRNAAAVLLAALVLGIWWARMALGAHYLTDLAGGGLLAVAIVAVALAVAPSAMFSRIAGRS